MKNIQNIKTFAEAAGVSTATVSRVFADDPKVRPATRDRVLAKAAELNFRPNRAAAAALFNGKTRSVGIIMMHRRQSYFDDIFWGIQQALLGKGYLPILLTTDWHDSLALIRRLVDHRVEGVMMIDTRREMNASELAEIDRLSLPLLYIDGTPGGEPFDRVTTDDAAGGRDAARYLLSLGHRRIALLDLPLPGETPPARRIGFLETLRASGVTPFFAKSPEELSAGLRGDGRPTAVFAANDPNALRVYQVCADLKLSIPGDVSVVGYADLDFAGSLAPALTTVRQDGVLLGKVAGMRLLARLGNRDLKPETLRIPVELVIRKSAAPPGNGISDNIGKSPKQPREKEE